MASMERTTGWQKIFMVVSFGMGAWVGAAL